MAVDSKADGDAEHGKAMGEVDSAVERIYDPSGLVSDEILTGGAFGVGLFADKVVCWVLFTYGGVDEGLDIWRC